MAFLCQCGKKWRIPRKPGGNTTFKCVCGRTVVVHNGIVYSGDKPLRASLR